MNTQLTTEQKLKKLELLHKTCKRYEKIISKLAPDSLERELFEEKLEDATDEFISLTNEINAK